MASWDKDEFEAQAAQIAGAYRAGLGQNGADINALAAKVARDNTLTDEQVRRLVRAANSAAFDQEYEHRRKTGSADRIVEFDPGDAEAVIREITRTAAPAGSVTKTASVDRYPVLPDQLRAPRGGLPVPRTKTASVQENLDAIERIIGKARAPHVEYARQTKIAAELDVRRKSAERTWNETMTDLAQAARGLYFDRDTFEKNALAVLGGNVLIELNALRADRRLAPLIIPTAKLAELDDRLIGVPTRETEALKTAGAARAAYHQLGVARALVGEKLAALAAARREVSHG